MKKKLNEIGNTPQGMYALGQVTARAYDRMLDGSKRSVGDGIVALNPKYGKIAQDAAYAAAGGYMDWRKKFKEQDGREPSYEEYRAWMQNYDNGKDDYGKSESERKGVMKINESQLRKMIAESVKKALSERYLEPGTADYETDKIAGELKRFYPQYENFVDEYVYGGYYEEFAKRANPDIRGGFREFVKSKQLGNAVTESMKKALKEGDFRGPNDTERLAGDIMQFILQAEKKYPKSHRYEAVKQVLDACDPKNNITYGREDDIDHGHNFGY